MADPACLPLLSQNPPPRKERETGFSCGSGKIQDWYSNSVGLSLTVLVQCARTQAHTHTLKKKTAAGVSPPRNSHMKERVEGVSVCVVADSKRTKCLSVHVCAAEDQVCVGICVCGVVSGVVSV